MDDEAFWLRHLRHGLVLFAVGIGVALLYIAFGDPVHGDRAGGLAGVAATSVAAVAALPHRTIVRSPRRNAFFYSWTGFSVGYVLLVTAVDGGAGSPLALLLVLPVVYSGLAYPPLAVIGVAVAAGLGYVAVAVVGPTAPAGEVIMLTGSLLGTGVTAAAVARSRQHAHADLAALHHRLEEAARRDSLTGCLTRAAFHEAVATELARARRHGRAASVLMVDLDDFKRVNDADGHLAGDLLLDRVGRVLLASLRAIDDAGRVGGDEFAVVLAEAGRDDARYAADRLLGALGAHGVAVSIGVATAASGDDTESLLARADAALYDAKRAGKGQVVAVDA